MKIIQDKSLARWEEYRNLRIQALKDAPQAFLDDIDEAERRPKEEWQDKSKNVYFAEENNKLIGMIAAYQDKRSKLKHILNIVSFYVLPEYRGQGVGKALLMKIIDEAKQIEEVKKLQLGVITTQESAYQLYLSLGFKKVGEQKYAVKVGDRYFDEYLMELYLD